MKKTLLTAVIICSIFTSFGQQVFMQGWYWDYPKTANGFSWADTLRIKAPQIKASGFTHVWFPPHATASFGTRSNGYDPKDLFIGNETTGLGTRAALNNMLTTFTAQGIAPVGDLIYNHRDGGRPETNSAVRQYITNAYNASKSPFPQDRYFCALPIGGTTGNGAGDYFFKFSSKSGDGRFNGRQYKLYTTTSLTGFIGAVTETEPNGGSDCTQPVQPLLLGQDLLGTIENAAGVCGTDEVRLTVSPGQFNPAGDTILLFLNNRNSDYSDFRIYGLFSSTRGSTNFENEILYRTFTDFSNLPSGRGQMNFEFFKPNSNTANTTGLNGSSDEMLFFYDYDQNQPQTRDTLIDYTKWNWDVLGIRGIRMDAVKQFPAQFVGQMLTSMHNAGKNPSLVVGEYFDTNTGLLAGWVNDVNANMSASARNAIQPKVFDFSLREGLRNACDNTGYDVRNLYNSSVRDATGLSGFNIVTFANNHDFREGGGFNSLIRNNTDLAYAYMLTNNQLGVPTVFYPDYYGYPAAGNGLYGYHPIGLPAYKTRIDSLIFVLRNYINGSPSVDYLNRNGSPFLNVNFTGNADKALVYQLQGFVGNGNRDIIVAVNYSDQPLSVRQTINNRGGAISNGTQFFDILGRSTFPTMDVVGGTVSFELPAKSYTVWAQNSLIVVPVKLLSFNASHIENNVRLNWKVDNESNTLRYNIERSVDGISFTGLGDVAAFNTPTTRNYIYNDANLPNSKKIFYRLKIIEIDGKFTYSDIVRINLNNTSFAVDIFPNPAIGNNLVLAMENTITGKISVNIFDAKGRRVSSLQFNATQGTTNFPIDISKFAAGSYTLKADNGAEKISKQFIKQ